MEGLTSSPCPRAPGVLSGGSTSALESACASFPGPTPELPRILRADFKLNTVTTNSSIVINVQFNKLQLTLKQHGGLGVPTLHAANNPHITYSRPSVSTVLYPRIQPPTDHVVLSIYR